MKTSIIEINSFTNTLLLYINSKKIFNKEIKWVNRRIDIRCTRNFYNNFMDDLYSKYSSIETGINNNIKGNSKNRKHNIILSSFAEIDIEFIEDIKSTELKFYNKKEYLNKIIIYD